jgi:hypothetical protein
LLPLLRWASSLAAIFCSSAAFSASNAAFSASL